MEELNSDLNLFQTPEELESFLNFAYAELGLSPDSPEIRDSEGPWDNTSSESNPNSTGASSPEVLRNDVEDGREAFWGNGVAIDSTCVGSLLRLGRDGSVSYESTESETEQSPVVMKREALEGSPSPAERSRSRSPATMASPKPDGSSTRKRKLNEKTETDVSSVSILAELEAQKEMEQDKGKKNALIAKINREKRKMKTGNLEKVNRSLEIENGELRAKFAKKDQECENLKTEVQYLKNVLQNQSALSHLLENIPQSGVRLSSSFVGDHDNRKIHRTEEETKVEAGLGSGICLHVNQNNVSLEFCSKCANMVSQNLSIPSS